MIGLLQIVAFSLATWVAAAALACAGVRRVCPAMLDRLRRVRVVSAAGAFSGVVAVSPRFLDGGTIPVADIALVPLCGLLAAAAYVDWATAWAPDELTVPICLLSGLVGFGGATEFECGVVTALGLGFAIFAVARGAWHLQAKLSQKIFPPPDVVGIVLPMVLLDSWILVALNMALLALVLAAVRCSPQLAGLAGNRECLAIALGDTGCSGPANGVAFLGVAYPLAVAFLNLQILVGRDGTFAF